MGAALTFTRGIRREFSPGNYTVRLFENSRSDLFDSIDAKKGQACLPFSWDIDITPSATSGESSGNTDPHPYFEVAPPSGINILFSQPYAITLTAPSQICDANGNAVGMSYFSNSNHVPINLTPATPAAAVKPSYCSSLPHTSSRTLMLSHARFQRHARTDCTEHHHVHVLGFHAGQGDNIHPRSHPFAALRLCRP